MITDLNEDVLEAALAQLPELCSLHVMRCPKVDHNCVLRVARYTPLLENLSMTISVCFSTLSINDIQFERDLISRK